MFRIINNEALSEDLKQQRRVQEFLKKQVQLWTDKGEEEKEQIQISSDELSKFEGLLLKFNQVLDNNLKIITRTNLNALETLRFNTDILGSYNNLAFYLNSIGYNKLDESEKRKIYSKFDMVLPKLNNVNSVFQASNNPEQYLISKIITEIEERRYKTISDSLDLTNISASVAKSSQVLSNITDLTKKITDFITDYIAVLDKEGLNLAPNSKKPAFFTGNEAEYKTLKKQLNKFKGILAKVQNKKADLTELNSIYSTLQSDLDKIKGDYLSKLSTTRQVKALQKKQPKLKPIPKAPSPSPPPPDSPPQSPTGRQPSPDFLSATSSPAGTPPPNLNPSIRPVLNIQTDEAFNDYLNYLQSLPLDQRIREIEALNEDDLDQRQILKLNKVLSSAKTQLKGTPKPKPITPPPAQKPLSKKEELELIEDLIARGEKAEAINKTDEFLNLPNQSKTQTKKLKTLKRKAEAL